MIEPDGPLSLSRQSVLGVSRSSLYYRPKGESAENLALMRRIDELHEAGVAFSMDGRGRFLDNIFIERLWRSLKYEAVYLHELRDGLDAERIIGSWIDFYNEARPHSALGGSTPGETYRNGARAA